MKPQWWVSCKPMAEEALKVSAGVPMREAIPLRCG
jgi:hypothetical protein